MYNDIIYNEMYARSSPSKRTTYAFGLRLNMLNDDIGLDENSRICAILDCTNEVNDY